MSRVEPFDYDALVVVMLAEIHAHLPEEVRPMSMMDLSDEQANRARKAVRAVILGTLLSKPGKRYPSVAAAILDNGPDVRRDRTNASGIAAAAAVETAQTGSTEGKSPTAEGGDAQ